MPRSIGRTIELGGFSSRPVNLGSVDVVRQPSVSGVLQSYWKSVATTSGILLSETLYSISIGGTRLPAKYTLSIGGAMLPVKFAVKLPASVARAMYHGSLLFKVIFPVR